MVISKKYNFIYIALPKTGTTSIQKCFSNLDDETLFIENKNLDDHGQIDKSLCKHIKSCELRKKIKNYDSYFKFAFVRNPWDLVVSWYAYVRRLPLSSSRSSKGISFKKFINEMECVWGQGLQTKWILDESGNQLVDFVGKFENLQEDFDIVCKMIGVKQSKLPHKNKSNHKFYKKIYDQETREIVAEKYAKDIEYFGYEFGE